MQTVPSRDARIGRYSKNTKFFAKILGKFTAQMCKKKKKLLLHTHLDQKESQMLITLVFAPHSSQM